MSEQQTPYTVDDFGAVASIVAALDEATNGQYASLPPVVKGYLRRAYLLGARDLTTAVRADLAAAGPYPTVSIGAEVWP